MAGLLVNTWQYVDGHENYLRRLETTLTGPTARVAIIDWREGDWPPAPGAFARLPRADAAAEFERSGWTLELESEILPYQYFLVFAPPAETD